MDADHFHASRNLNSRKNIDIFKGRRTCDGQGDVYLRVHGSDTVDKTLHG